MFFGGDPFEHFAHAHGGGGGRASRGGGGADPNADTTKLYETLGVSVMGESLLVRASHILGFVVNVDFVVDFVFVRHNNAATSDCLTASIRTFSIGFVSCFFVEEWQWCDQNMRMLVVQHFWFCPLICLFFVYYHFLG